MPITPLKLISSMAVRIVLRELAAQYEAGTHQAVETEAAGGVDVAKRVDAGEAVDVVVLASKAIDKLLAADKLLAGSRVDLVRSGVAVAVRAGAPRPDVSSEAALRQAVESAPSLSYSTGPSGTYLESLFARWGILERIRSRIVVPPPGVPVGSLVADSRAALGFQQFSELMNLADVDVVGPLPPAVQTTTIFSGGISAESRHVADARLLLDYLASPAGDEIKRRHGMEPA